MRSTTTKRTTSQRLGDLLTPAQLAERLGIPETTLTDWRYRRRGPAWVRVGRLVRYPAAMVDEWLAARLERPA